MAAIFAAIVVFTGGFVPPVAAAGPFPDVPLSEDRRPSYRAAYACLAVGAGLVGASFAFSHRANQEYDRYLAASDPQEILHRFDETERYDRMSSASLLTGEALFAVGVYLRFLRPPPDSRLTLSLDPGRCAVSYRF